MAKISRYNHLQPWAEGHWLAFNAASGALGLLTTEHYEIYQKLKDKLNNGGAANLSDEESALLKQLEYGRFVIPDEIDEQGMLRFNHNLARYDRSFLGLVVAPTMACNMDCKYCYEDKTPKKMSGRIIEALIKFVEDRADAINVLDVGWYGGEPLLAMDIIEDLSETFMDLAKEYRFKYSSSIITNGYLLDKEKVDKLAAWQVKSAQVTLDGPKEMHNKKRPLKNGKESFDTILENVLYATTKIGVGVRINVDKSYTLENIGGLLDQLTAAGLKDRVTVYFGQLEAATSVCSSIADACYDIAGFAGIEADYYKLVLERGFQVAKVPEPMSTFCMAQQVSSFVVDTDGDTYRCWNHVGNKKRTAGNIGGDPDYTNPNFRRLFEFDPFTQAECVSCNLLPDCMGGCPDRRAERNDDGTLLCESWKYNLKPMLEIIAASRQRQSQPKGEE